MIRRLRDEGPALAVLGLIMVAGLVLRVVHNDHGLPYVYYVDEGSHFTKRAVEVFRDAEPGLLPEPVGVHLPAAPALPRRCRCRSAAARRSSAATATTPTGSSSSRAGSRRCSASPASRPSTSPGASCGTAAPGSSPPRSSASRSCRSRSRASRSPTSARSRRSRSTLLFAVRIHETGGLGGAPRRASRPGWRSASSTRPGSCCSPRRSRWRCRSLARARPRRAARRRARRRSRVGGGALLAVPRHEPVLLHRPRHRAAPAARPGRAGRQPGQVRPGARHRASSTTSTA